MSGHSRQDTVDTVVVQSVLFWALIERDARTSERARAVYPGDHPGAYPECYGAGSPLAADFVALETLTIDRIKENFRSTFGSKINISETEVHKTIAMITGPW